MAQPRHPSAKYAKHRPHPINTHHKRPKNGKSLRIATSSSISSSKKSSPSLSRRRSQSNPTRRSASGIPQLPRIKRLSVIEEIKLAEDTGMNGMTSHNIACIVNRDESEQSSSFLTDFIFDENDVSSLIDPTPPSYLQYAAKRKITPCRRKRMAVYQSKLTPFKTMDDLKTHRFHLAELFQNDCETNKGLKECFEKVPHYFFIEEYESLPSKKKNKEEDSEEEDMYYRSHRMDNLLLKDCKNHKILRNQEKLGNYLDIVEVNLLKQICIQSDSFFSGLENIQLLQNDVIDILNNIQYLRTNLHRMEQYEVMSWSKMINLGIKHNNYHAVLSITSDIHNLQILYKNLNKLIRKDKYNESVDILTQSKLIINKYKKEIDVINVLSSRLLLIESTLSIKLIYKICDFAIQLNENKSENHISKYIKSCILLQSPSKSVQIIYNTLRTKFEEKISKMYQLKRIANIENYINNIDDDNQYMIILQNIYNWATIILLSQQSITQLFTQFLNKGSFDTHYYIHINAETINKYSESSSTYSQSLCSQILSLSSILLSSRNVKNSFMSLDRVKCIFAKTLSFLQNIESITNTTCYEIRGVLLKQAQSFLDNFHKYRIERLNTALSTDKWTSVRVAVDVQHDVDALQSGEKCSELAQTEVALEAIIIHISDKSILRRTSMNIEIVDDDLYDDVDDLRFKSVSCLLCLLKLVYEYIECATKLPPIAYDVENKLISLFTVFNSKTCHLVLGAGAMQSVNLKAITAKHLALAQQCISVLLILLPNIHKKWFSKLIPRNCLPLIQSQINRLNQDLEQHSNEIFKKLISIMEQLIDFKFNLFETYLFETQSNPLNVRVHSSISSLMAESRKMYRLISTYMQSYQISIIFKPIVMQFDMKLNALIIKLNKEKDNDNIQYDIKQSIHSLNMAIKFISDKLTRLNCDAQYLANLCIQLD